MSNDLLTLKGQLLIATPRQSDSFFAQSVCYLCQHDDQGAIGLLINQPIAMSVTDLFSDQGLAELPTEQSYQPLLIGGPLQRERGFVLHRDAGHWRSTLKIQEDIYVTTSQDILQAIAAQKPPHQYLIILGYASWAPGQLEHEISQNDWLITPSNFDLLFHTDYALRWHNAIATLGFDANMLSKEFGHA
jgi:putative transcriptional regulator